MVSSIEKKTSIRNFEVRLGHHFDQPEHIMANLQQGIW